MLLICVARLVLFCSSATECQTFDEPPLIRFEVIDEAVVAPEGLEFKGFKEVSGKLFTIFSYKNLSLTGPTVCTKGVRI